MSWWPFGRKKPKPVLVETGAFFYGHAIKRDLAWCHLRRECDPSAVEETTEELLIQIEDAAYQAFGDAVTITRRVPWGEWVGIPAVDIKGKLFDVDTQGACDKFVAALNNPN